MGDTPPVVRLMVPFSATTMARLAPDTTPLVEMRSVGVLPPLLATVVLARLFQPPEVQTWLVSLTPSNRIEPEIAVEQVSWLWPTSMAPVTLTLPATSRSAIGLLVSIPTRPVVVANSVGVVVWPVVETVNVPETWRVAVGEAMPIPTYPLPAIRMASISALADEPVDPAAGAVLNTIDPGVPVPVPGPVAMLRVRPEASVPVRVNMPIVISAAVDPFIPRLIVEASVKDRTAVLWNSHDQPTPDE